MRRGFTLIELLVVIAIIAILAAILFPVFARAREKARQTACLSNVKQMCLAFLQYVQDYDERFPGGVTPNVGTWHVAITPYCKNTQIFSCPSHEKDGYSYGVPYNNMFHDAGSGPRGVKLTALTAPSESLLMCDSQRNDGYGTWYLYSLKTYTYPLGASETSTNSIPVPGRHNDGNNVGFCDGHAKWVNTTTLTNRSWSGWTTQPAAPIQ